MGRKKRERVETGGDGFTGQLADLLRARGLAPAEGAPEPEPVVEEPPRVTLADCRRVVVRVSSKGRRGKTVTLVERLPEDLRAQAAKTLRRALGCGATIEDAAVVVQGDQRDRVTAWLTAQGVRDVRGG